MTEWTTITASVKTIEYAFIDIPAWLIGLYPDDKALLNTGRGGHASKNEEAPAGKQSSGFPRAPILITFFGLEVFF